MNNLTKTYFKSLKLGSIVDTLHYLAQSVKNCVKLLEHKALHVYYVKSLRSGSKALYYIPLSAVLLLGSMAHSLAHAEISYPKIDLSAIQRIESQGCKSPCIGDSGKALGIFQLHAGVIKDYNRAHNTKISHRMALLSDTALIVANWYLNTKIPQYLAFYKLPDTLENRLSAYNMGIGSVLKGKSATSYIKKYKELTQ